MSKLAGYNRRNFRSAKEAASLITSLREIRGTEHIETGSRDHGQTWYVTWFQNEDYNKLLLTLI